VVHHRILSWPGPLLRRRYGIGGHVIAFRGVVICPSREGEPLGVPKTTDAGYYLDPVVVEVHWTLAGVKDVVGWVVLASRC
jgi:hypothetical protein